MSRVFLQNISRSSVRNSNPLLIHSNSIPTILSSLRRIQSLPFITTPTRRTVSILAVERQRSCCNHLFASSPTKFTTNSNSFLSIRVSSTRSFHLSTVREAEKQHQLPKQKHNQDNQKRIHTALITITAAFVLAAGASFYAKTAFSTPQESLTSETHIHHSPLEPQYHTMVIPPGRPETLTPEQEQVLKEFWLASFVVFGVATTLPKNLSILGTDPSTTASSTDLTASTTPSETTTSTTTTDTTPAASVNEKKKSTSRFWSRSSKKETPTPQSTTTTGTAPDIALAATIAKAEGAQDKYGQSKQFKKILESMRPGELREAFWDMVKHDNPDGLLLRFLRARKWDVDDALFMMVSTMHWRLKEAKVEELNKTGEEMALKNGQNGFLNQIRMGKSFLHGTDKEGRPICTVRVKLHRKSDQTEKDLENYTVYIMETARLMLKHPVDTATVIFDLTDFSLKNMDVAPVKYLVKCFEAHYPESLGILLIHGAPWGFDYIYTTVIAPLLDPVVAAKIKFSRSTAQIEEYIARDQIPKALGGDEDWEYKYIEPVEGENEKLKDTEGYRKLREERFKDVARYEQLTREWIAAPLRTETSEDEKVKVIKKERNEIAKKLETGYWEIDEYVRAKTVYDRMGNINKGGKIVYYPEAVGKLAEGVEGLKVEDHTEVD